MLSVNASTSFHNISMMRLLESAKNMCSFYVTCLCQQSVYFEAYFGLPVAPWAYKTAETWGQQPAEGELQEGDVLPEEANSHQGEQAAVWENRQRPS